MITSVKSRQIHLVIVLILVVLSINVYAFNNAPRGARSIALGGGLTAAVDSGLGDALSLNPAGLVNSFIGVNIYYDNHFSISGYETKGISVNTRLGKAGFGLNYNMEGVILPEEKKGIIIENFLGEQQLTFGCGYPMSRALNVGFSLTRIVQNAKIYGENPISSNLITIDAGVLWNREKFSLGFAALRVPANGAKNLVKPEYSFGIRLGDVGSFAVNVDYTLVRSFFGKHESSLHGGVEVWFLPNLTIRLGIDQANTLALGMGINKNNWQIDYAYRVHSAGNTHYFSSGYRF